jgi:hypothetical protein
MLERLHIHRTPLGAAGLMQGRQIWLAAAVSLAALIALIWGFAKGARPFFVPF